MAPIETEVNAYAKFWGDKQRALWYVMVFSSVANCEGLRPAVNIGKVKRTCDWLSLNPLGNNAYRAYRKI